MPDGDESGISGSGGGAFCRAGRRDRRDVPARRAEQLFRRHVVAVRTEPAKPLAPVLFDDESARDQRVDCPIDGRHAGCRAKFAQSLDDLFGRQRTVGAEHDPGNGDALRRCGLVALAQPPAEPLE